MKVLQINSVCGIGSTGKIATDINSILIEQGHESFIAFGRDLPKNCGKSIRIGNRFDNYRHVVLTRLFDRHGLGSKKGTLDFIEKVRNLDPDIIHLHNIHGYYINIKILFDYLKEINKPVIWTLHDCWAFTGHCSHFDYVGCDKWKNACYNCPRKKEYPKSLLLDSSKNNYLQKKEIFSGMKNLTIVTPSKWLANLVKESFLKQYTVKTINNGIDLNIFKPTKSDFRRIYNIENKFVILGVAGVWGERKGFNHFIEMSGRLKSDETIVLVGITEKQKKNLPRNIIGVSKTNNTQELAEIYTSSDVFVNPTLEDNFPTVNIEALACGTPVIAFDTGGCIESVDNGSGLVVPKGNVDHLIHEIRRSHINFDKYKCIRRSQLFDKNNKFIEYIILYNSMVDLS